MVIARTNANETEASPMRASVVPQPPLVSPIIDHPRATELEKMSRALDALGHKPVDLVWVDLTRGLRSPHKGRKGLGAEQLLRAAIIKLLFGFSYEQLAFHLADSRTFRRFCRLGIHEKPKKKALQQGIKRIAPETLEAINALLLGLAMDLGVDDGLTVRTDCTVEETNIHAPSDSSLLWDCVRVLSRLLHDASEFVRVSFSDHTKRAKRRQVKIQYASNEAKRKAPYLDLLKVTHKSIGYATAAASALDGFSGDIFSEAKAQGLAAELRHYTALTEKVINQTERRVIHGEKLTAEEKIVSIFEPHTDIIIKDRREVQYGHKLCLTTGQSGMVFDCMVLKGNPADSQLAVRAIQRIAEKTGTMPHNAAFDGGFASRENLRVLKEDLGLQNVAFKKKRGLKVEAMTENSIVYRSLVNFRAGVEAGISFLKRCFGLGRCTWRGWDSFSSYTWASILSANLLIFARQAPG